MSIRYYRSVLKDEPDVLTVPDVSRILRIGKNKTYELIHTRQISALKLGKRLLVPKTVLIEFLDNEKNYLNLSEKI